MTKTLQTANAFIHLLYSTKLISPASLGYWLLLSGASWRQLSASPYNDEFSGKTITKLLGGPEFYLQITWDRVEENLKSKVLVVNAFTWELHRSRHVPERMDKSVVDFVGFNLTSSSISCTPSFWFRKWEHDIVGVITFRNRADLINIL